VFILRGLGAIFADVFIPEGLAAILWAKQAASGADSMEVFILMEIWTRRTTEIACELEEGANSLFPYPCDCWNC
jgi:hypothetical protein